MLAESIKSRRAALGLSQEALAQKAGVSSRTIINAERGKGLNVHTLGVIAKALKCTEAELFLMGRK